MAKIGIVTVLYNSTNVLDDFFISLENQTYKDFVLYMVDNKSSDKTLEVVKNWKPKLSFPIIVFEENENWGVAKGNNIGIKRALDDKCDYVLLANNDIVFGPNTIEDLLKGLITEDADMAVPKILFHDTGLIWAAGGEFLEWKGTTRQIGYLHSDSDEYKYNKLVSYSPTCFMLIKSEVFRDVGLMDEKYFVYYDDSDFIWRAVKKHSKKLFYIANSELYHKVSSLTGGDESNFSIYYLNRNNKYFIRKNFPFFKRQFALLYRLLSLYKHRKSYGPEKFKLIKKAHKDSILLLKNTTNSNNGNT